MIKIINGIKFRVEKLLCPFSINRFHVSGGWGPWIVRTPTGHLALDGWGVDELGRQRGPWNQLQAVLSGVLCNVTDIPLFAGRKFLNKQGFGLKCDSGEYVHYHHCDIKMPIGTRVKRGQKGIGIISPDNDGSPGWQGPHCEFRLITSKGMVQVHPFNFQDRSVKLYGQYRDKQYRDNADQYIWTNLGKVDVEPQKKYYTVKYGGWRWNIINEILDASIWTGSWNKHYAYFNILNPKAPNGGWKKGDKVRIK